MKSLLRNLAYASVTVAALAATAHYLGQPARAQSGSASVVAISPQPLGGQGQTVITADGDIYRVSYDPTSGALISVRQGNVFALGAPTPTQNKSWGQIKAGH